MHGGCVYCSHGDCPRIYHYGFTRFGKPDTTMRRERERGDSKGPQCHLLAGLHCMFAQHYPNCVLPSHWWITKTLNKISCVSLAHFFWYIKPCSLMFPRFSHVFSMCSYVFPMFPMFSIVFPCVLQVFQRFFLYFGVSSLRQLDLARRCGGLFLRCNGLRAARLELGLARAGGRSVEDDVRNANQKNMLYDYLMNI